MNRAARPARVRFYFDADVLGVARVVARLRSDATYPGDPGATIHKRDRPPCPITDPATLDRIWIPAVAERVRLIITRDSRIQEHRAEIAAVRDNGAKMIALTGKDARNTLQQLEVVMCQWRRIEELADVAGPCIWRATRTSLGRVTLD
ncbi:MAG: hypothetical protein ACLP50_27365 [Solirubrobacteraceae bacterium]